MEHDHAPPPPIGPVTSAENPSSSWAQKKPTPSPGVQLPVAKKIRLSTTRHSEPPPKKIGPVRTAVCTRPPKGYLLKKGWWGESDNYAG